MSVKNRVFKSGLCEITQVYKKGTHNGIDLVDKGYTIGTIVAHSCGTVIAIQTGMKNNVNATGDATYGNYVKIQHPNGMKTLYAHLANNIKVKKNQEVKAGTILATMGNTGRSYGAHLHLEVRNENDDKIDPTPYLNSDEFILTNKTTPISRDKTKNQIKILVSELRIRTTPNTTATILGTATKNGIYNYYEKTTANGYTWYRIDKNNWIAYQEGWLVIMEAYKELYDDSQKQVELLNKEIASKIDKIALLEKDNEELRKDVSNLNKKIDNLNDKLTEYTNIPSIEETDENSAKKENIIVQFIIEIFKKIFKK